MQTAGLHKNNLFILKFRLQITTPKFRNFASLVQREVVFCKKNRRDWLWYDNLICKRTYKRISYINKIFSISQSADADSSLYQREPCCSLVLKCWFTTKQVYLREPVLQFVIDACLYRNFRLNNLKINPPGVRWPLTPSSLAQGGQVCSLFNLIFYSGK